MIINRKEIVEPGKFIIIEQPPQERLIELQKRYNSMEYEPITKLNYMKAKCYINEINMILKLHPELNNNVELKAFNISSDDFITFL